MADDIAPAIVSAADRMDDRKFAAIRVDPFDRMVRQMFHVTGVSSTNPEERRDFELFEDAVNFLHKQGFRRLDDDEEESMLNVINDGKKRIEYTGDEHAGVTSFANAVFSKPTSPEDYAAPGPNNGANELAAAILENAQAIAKKRDLPQIVTIGKVADDSVGPQQYWVRGMPRDSFPSLNRNGLFTYYEGALNFLTGKGCHRLESTQEERWKQLIDRANYELEDQFTYYGGKIVCVFSMN